ncbi:hypothetical protein C7B65_22815 [Phormidesmis priestleyi ULC007]|uniref:Uncharacterized protein n=1 Tax=Phormidesmis priestleyi ULC007 TaxID=1920490 RepID=A0A2T1D6E6_9CYAN|nr:hypothetical protein [Phormidesmis priestleyi]PSB16060.1 hypothetical protein C7B65_22815 [Phormidesmis priestleyi ULC007]PZO52256.1 MAG: hypothetical protein DCF14_07265 [Phormidesmis priestleyi]
MNIDEFEAQTRDSLERALNQLQTATLLLAALEIQVLESGNTIKDLSQIVETFIAQQRDRDSISGSN